MVRYIGVVVLSVALGAIAAFVVQQFHSISVFETLLIFSAAMAVVISVKTHIQQEMALKKVRDELANVTLYEAEISKRLGEIEQLARDGEAQSKLWEHIERLEYRVNDLGNIVSASPAASSQAEPGFLEDEETAEQHQDNVISLASVTGSANRTLSDKVRIPSNLSKAVDDGKLVMHLQPVLSLIDRTVLDYEALARLELGNNKLAQAFQFIPRAVKTGCIAEIDHRMLFNVIKLIRELSRNDIQPNIFWNLSGACLKSQKTFTAFENILRANSNVCNQITVEISQLDYLELKAGSLRKLSALRELGLNVSADTCTNLDEASKMIRSKMFSDIKVPTSKLIGYDEHQIEMAGQEISELGMDNNVRIIATQVEREFQVMELIDQDILHGQGNLFSEPKPARTKTTPTKLASIN